MLLNKAKTAIKNKHYLILVLGFGLMIFCGKAFSQTTPPPPPPSPVEVFNKINPFKKNKKTKDTVKKKDTSKINPAASAGPPPPPNPLNLFKKKKKDTSKAAPVTPRSKINTK
jgi:type IV secretory pathway VirB10-like protein